MNERTVPACAAPESHVLISHGVHGCAPAGHLCRWIVAGAATAPIRIMESFPASSVHRAWNSCRSSHPHPSVPQGKRHALLTDKGGWGNWEHGTLLSVDISCPSGHSLTLWRGSIITFPDLSPRSSRLRKHTQRHAATAVFACCRSGVQRSGAGVCPGADQCHPSRTAGSSSIAREVHHFHYDVSVPAGALEHDPQLVLPCPQVRLSNCQ